VTAKVPIYASAFTNPSSIRYKENVKDLDLEYAKQILKLRPVTYDYKNKENGINCVGLIAEEVYDYISYPVIFSENVIEGLDYAKLVTPILKILQDHEKRLSFL